ncbi:MAG: PKD domain-containing protein [Thermodesulfobacteriota bacterium]
MGPCPRRVLSLLLLFAVLALGPWAESADAGRWQAPFRDGELIVKLKDGVSRDQARQLHGRKRALLLKEYRRARLQQIRLRKGMTVEEAVDLYQADPDVEYAEPNFVLSTESVPNDPKYYLEWGLENTGQLNGASAGHDIRATAAWETTTGHAAVVVAVIDTGVDYRHPDLAANMWSNEAEANGQPGVDDDGNGHIDDLHGIDTINNDADPMDDNRHGTHVAGTIGAAGNNAIGVAGVAWDVRIMACKFLGASGSGYTSDAVDCLEYVKTMRDRGVNVVATNNSWGGGGYSRALHDAIRAQEDILFVAAAGNNGDNNDLHPHYPSSYPAPNLISVAATDYFDRLTSFSNYGVQSVHVAAPGYYIYSTLPNNAYGYLSGTSMATPHVTGLAALLKAASPGMAAGEVRAIILDSGDPLATVGRLVTDRRINAERALQWASPEAAFAAAPTEGEYPLAVRFTNQSTFAGSWLWDFGDGATSTAREPEHVYQAAGVYTVRLTAFGAGGSSDVEEKVDLVTVRRPTLNATFQAQPQAGSYPLTVRFTVAASLASAWLWDFGDGQMSVSREPVHTYTREGSYTVRLTAVSPDGEAVTEEKAALIQVGHPSPLVAFAMEPTAGMAPLTVAFRQGSLFADSYVWDFGDGAMSTEPAPVHTYTAPGTYSVLLVASGPGGTDNRLQSEVVTVTAPPPQAAFSATPLAGVAPLTVLFRDASENASAWSWDFGDSAADSRSQAQSPQHTFRTPGTYSVTLAVSGPGGEDSITRTDLVTVGAPPPTASFGASPTTGVASLAVRFSYQGQGATAWVWAFGDGSTSQEANPVHTYANPGRYSVALAVSGPGGQASTTRQDLVRVTAPPPAVDFAASPVAGVYPLVVAFSDASSWVDTWSWDFGDGTGSSAASPTHTYVEPGLYTVTLTGTGPGGQGVRRQKGLVLVSHPRPEAAFAASPAAGVAPLVVTFTNQSRNADSWRWDFGDGSTGTEQQPRHTYSVPGSYTVTLTASGPGGEATISRAGLVTVRSDEPLAGFSATPLAGTAPLAVAFTDASGSGTRAWQWDFGDGGTSAEQHPRHTYSAAGRYTVTLVASGADGATRYEKTDYVLAQEPAPEARFSAAPPTGAAPLAVSFTDASSHATAWLWDFGDGSTSAEQHPRHTYQSPGSYAVRLAVTGPGGSAQAGGASLVTALLPAPQAGFAAVPAAGTLPLTVAFTDSSTGATSWHWDFGDGASSTERQPRHTYSAAGVYPVTLTVTNQDGSAYLTQASCVTVRQPTPVASFQAQPVAGAFPLAVSFTDQSANASSWLWDFGDGATSAERHPRHTYATAGAFTVTLTAANPDGSHQKRVADLVTVRHPAPVADFGLAPASGPYPLAVAFQDRSSQATGWRWDFGDGATSGEPSPRHTYETPGVYPVTLTVTNPDGSDTTSRAGAVTVLHPAPRADFAAAPLSGLAPLTVSFADSSENALYPWWELGDGTVSGAAALSHTYAQPGRYQARLTVAGLDGEGSDSRTVEIVALYPAPQAQFAASPSAGVYPLAVRFENQSGNASSWLWDFGDGFTSTEEQPVHTYTSAGRYTVTLTATNPDGSATWSAPEPIAVGYPLPEADFAASSLTGPAPLAVAFQSLARHASSWLWDFGDGETSTDEHPQHIYAEPGLYTVTLTVTNPAGSDRQEQADLVQVAPPVPQADFSWSPATGVAPLAVAFVNSSEDADRWLWDFGDGANSSEAAPRHTFQAPGRYTVTLTATGPGGSDTARQPDAVVVLPAPPQAAFVASPEAGVAPLTVAFTDTSQGASAWQWDFGDGTGSSAQHPRHEYGAAGFFTVTLRVSGAGGAAEASGTIVVQPAPPRAAFQATPTAGVYPLTVTFTDTSQSASAWVWDFGDGTGSRERHPVHVYQAAGSYTVRLTATGAGGEDRLERAGLVQVGHPLPAADFSAMPTRGEPPLEVAFTDQSRYATSWIWDFGDGTGSTEANPRHVYEREGTYTVTLTVRNPGGADSEIRIGWVQVTRPVTRAAFTLSPTQGPAPLAVSFSDQSTNATVWSWDFGDGTGSTEQQPAHTYQTPGVYTVSLVVSGAGGQHRLSKSNAVSVRQPAPVADFSASPLAGPQAPLVVQFQDASQNAASFLWDFGDRSYSAEPSPRHTYYRKGVYTVSLRVSNLTGTSTRTQEDLITVGGSTTRAAFTASPLTGQAPLHVVFRDDSDRATSWAWDFGDGYTGIGRDQVHAYTMPGTYTVTLRVTGPDGVEDTLVQEGYVTVTGPPGSCQAAFQAQPTRGDAPLSVSFFDRTQGATAWSWDFGDGTSSQEQNPAHTYQAAGSYTVTLVAEANGVRCTTRQPNLIVVQPPPVQADFVADLTSGPFPLAVQYTEQSRNAGSWHWDFGDGSTSDQASPSHVYTEAGSYTVSFTASGPGGSDTETKASLITVTPPASALPRAGFVASPASGAYPLAVAFDNTSANAESCRWDFGDGVTSTLAEPVHIYVAPGTYTVTLEVSGRYGTDQAVQEDCVTVTVPADGSITRAGFEAEPLAGVGPLTVSFRNRSVNGLSYAWDFGDGSSSTEEHPRHTYQRPGTFTVRLTAFGAYDESTLVQEGYILVTAPPAPLTPADPWPADGAQGVDPGTSLSWLPGVEDPDIRYDVYLGEAGGELTLQAQDVRPTRVEQAAADPGCLLIGDWTAETLAAGPWAGQELFRAPAGGRNFAVFMPLIPLPGRYGLEVAVQPDPELARQAAVLVVHARGTSLVTVDQSAGEEGWVSLGAFELAAGYGSAVILTSLGADGPVAALAVRLTGGIWAPDSGLEPGASYAWQVVAKNAVLETREGPVWQFVTAGAVDLQLRIGNRTIDEPAVTLAAGTPLAATVSVFPGSWAGQPGEVWLSIAHAGTGSQFWRGPDSWSRQVLPYAAGSLAGLAGYPFLPKVQLPAGSWELAACVDDALDGVRQEGRCDAIQVLVR